MNALLLQVDLHPTQAAFRESQALYRGFVGGRGAGKSYIGAYDLLRRTEPGRLYMVVAPTYTMLKDASARTFYALGEQLHFIAKVNRADMRATLGNGAEVIFRSGDEPDRLRGPNLSGLWLDEAGLMERGVYEIGIACLREGGRAGWLSATFTPKGRDHWTYEVFGTGRSDAALFHAKTNDNPFLPAQFQAAIRQQYTERMARQELEGLFLDDVPGALWQRERLDAGRVREAPDLQRVVVAVDPAVTSGEDADETGIIVAGKGADGRAYVLADLTCRLSPDGWARRAVRAYHEHGAARLVAEVNQGGDLVERVVRTVDPNVSYTGVRASKGKYTRAEPIAALYEQGRVSHIGGLSALEDQMCAYTPDGYDGSPDRVDALVWALTELMLNARSYAPL